MQNDTSKRHGLARFAETIRQARVRKGWSQRELGARAHMPQAQISRFENGDVDPQVSTLVELARTLDLDLQLVPRSAITAVEAAVRSAEEGSEERVFQELLAQLRKAARAAREAAPEREDIASIQASLGELEPSAPLLRGPEFIGELRRLLLNLEQFVMDPPAQRGRRARPMLDAADWLKRLRNQLVHAPGAERPAYRLGDEDEP